MNNDKLNDAIKTIKELCEVQKACIECPMNCNCGTYPAEWNNAIYAVIDEIDNAPTVEGKLSDKQIEEIADLLEIQWGYEGIREDVSRILRGEDHD